MRVDAGEPNPRVPTHATDGRGLTTSTLSGILSKLRKEEKQSAHASNSSPSLVNKLKADAILKSHGRLFGFHCDTGCTRGHDLFVSASVLKLQADADGSILHASFSDGDNSKLSKGGRIFFFFFFLSSLLIEFAVLLLFDKKFSYRGARHDSFVEEQDSCVGGPPNA